MLSAPGFRFHRTLTPFFQLVVGPAQPAVCGVLGYTSFYVFWFSVFLFRVFIFIAFYFYSFYFYCACPCLPWVPRVWFYAWVTHDVTGDSVPFLGFRLLAMPGLVCYLTRSLDSLL